MEPGIMLYIDCKVDVYEQIKILKETGVRRTFINAKHPEIDKVLCAIKDAGLICDNLHAEYAITHNGEKIHIDDISREGKAGDIMTSKSQFGDGAVFVTKLTLRFFHELIKTKRKLITEIAMSFL